MRHLLISGLVLCGLGSCKTPTESSLQSLGALAGDKNPAVCSATPAADFSERYDTFWAQKSIVAAIGYKEPFRPIFAAVPTQLQSWFFLKGGKIQLIGGPKKFCDQAGGTPLFYASGDKGGCVVFPKNNPLVGMPTIYLGVTANTAHEQAEQASLIVSGFSAVLSSFLTEIALSDKLSNSNELLYEYGTYDTEMHNLKSSLAFMVIEDLLNNKNGDGKSFAESMPGDYKALIASSKVLDTSISRDARWKAFWAAYSDSGHRQMTNYFVAQAFETSWCSDTTRAVMFNKDAIFTKTGNYFKKSVEPVFTQVYSGAGGSVASLTEDNGKATPGTEVMSSAPNDSADSGMSLDGGRVFPVLAAVLNAPFAVSGYFAENRPVRIWFATYQPVSRVMFGTMQAIDNVARGTVIFTGRVVGGFVNAIGNDIDRIGWRLENGCFIRRWRC